MPYTLYQQLIGQLPDVRQFLTFILLQPQQTNNLHAMSPVLNLQSPKLTSINCFLNSNDSLSYLKISENTMEGPF